MNMNDAYNIIPYFLLFYVIARLEWLNYKIGIIEGIINEKNEGRD